MRLNLDKAARYQFAVLSMRADNGNNVELESSFESQVQAELMFERQYSKWGMTDQNFYLVNFSKNEVLKAHEVFKNEFTKVLSK
jgi:hypothetical protein